jgi:hypothetical protein
VDEEKRRQRGAKMGKLTEDTFLLDFLPAHDVRLNVVGRRNRHLHNFISAVGYETDQPHLFRLFTSPDARSTDRFTISSIRILRGKCR